MDFHHPLVRSVLLPLVLALVATGVLRFTAGSRWAGAGLGVALLAAALAVVGWQPRPGSLTEKLPWVVIAATLLALLLEAVRASRWLQWIVASAAWALALAALGVASLPAGALTWVIGAAALAAVLHARDDNADAPALLAVAGFGLAAVAMTAASLLLFELALGGAVATAGIALWLWPQPRIAFGAAGRVVAVLTWLALAHATARLTQAPHTALALLALVFAVGPLMTWWHPAAPAWASPLWRAAVAALLAVGGVALTVRAVDAPAPAPGAAQEDPYYTPRW
ncbi:MAG: hypothetical protein EOP81_10935 [Variovorax sp.]|nr:MAG: hypothetical protein EOP81_10935 [Variovorax sp.]